MAKLLMIIGRRLMISNREKSVRQSVIFLFTNLLLLAGIIFTLEIILIILGVENIFLPLTHRAKEFLFSLFF